jgi:hypothetical protein
MVSGIFYLYRRRVFTPLQTPTMRHATYTLHTHFRTIHPLPALLPPDTPANRQLTTVPDNERIPYREGFKPVLLIGEESQGCCR